MSKLASIRPYVEKLCNIMASVLETDVIIADADLCILGDWEHKGYVSDETESLQDSSVVARAMREARVIRQGRKRGMSQLSQAWQLQLGDHHRLSPNR